MAFKLSATERTAPGAKVRTRSALPAVLYGAGENPVSLTLNYEDFAKLYEEAGKSSLVDIFIGETNNGKVLIQDIQYDPLTDRMVHVDFRRIDMNKPITAWVELKFAGEAPVIKEQGGTLMHNIDKVEVKCLPKDLPSHLDVDLSVLTTFDHTIKVSDLKVGSGVEVLNPNAEDLVAKAAPALTEEEIKAMEAATPSDLSQIEVAGKKKEEEGEEAAEGGEAGKEKEDKEEKK